METIIKYVKSPPKKRKKSWFLLPSWNWADEHEKKQVMQTLICHPHPLAPSSSSLRLLPLSLYLFSLHTLVSLLTSLFPLSIFALSVLFNLDAAPSPFTEHGYVEFSLWQRSPQSKILSVCGGKNVLLWHHHIKVMHKHIQRNQQAACM